MSDAVVYIDGFNLYNGAVKGTPFKWLDLEALCTRLLPGRNIVKIRYFTAKIHAFPHDPNAPTRQDIYLRAVRILPLVSVHEGWFAKRPSLLPQYPFAYSNPTNPTRPPQAVQVLRMEEKWTDVQIATLLMVDCVDMAFDEAVLVSNDSDLYPPLLKAKERFGKKITVVNPHSPNKMSGQLIKIADHHPRGASSGGAPASSGPPTIIPMTISRANSARNCMAVDFQELPQDGLLWRIGGSNPAGGAAWRPRRHS